MATTENITLYTAKICPFAQRVEIAIAEAGAKNITQYQIDLQNKPEWYPKVNPVTKVPALAYGGPAVAPDQPSPDSVKIAESLVLLEFFADLYPSLLSKDPVKRAQARFAMDTVGTKVFPVFLGFAMRGDKTVEELLAGLEAFQSLLPAEGYAVGEWSIADAAVAPFLGRIEALLRNGAGKFKEEDGKAAYAELFQGAKFTRLQKYWQDISSRDSWKKTFDEDYIVNTFRARFSGSN